MEYIGHRDRDIQIERQGGRERGKKTEIEREGERESEG